MKKQISKKIVFIILLSIFFKSYAFSEIVNKIEIFGNDRIPTETIKIFSKVNIEDNVDEEKLNLILKNLYETDYFKSIDVLLVDNILKINVVENPIIYNLKFEGIKSKTLIEELTSSIDLKERSPYNKILLGKEKTKLKSLLRKKGYFFSKVDVYKEELKDNRVNVVIDIELGEKSKIKKISFIGDKKFKNKKLLNVIVSEEAKFWKFISGKKYLNEEIINLDKRLLKNFYLNKGFYKVKINSSFAKLINEDEFELIFNIDSGPKIYFGNLKLNLPIDYDLENFKSINNKLDLLKDTIYSLNKIDKILDEIDQIVALEQYETVNATVDESLENEKLNLTFNMIEENKSFIQRINISGNSITDENVIRNQLLIDEGDPYNKILEAKSINNIKSLNFFREVKSNTINTENNKKIINISVEEKPTGEIMAGAGFGTSGSSVAFGVKENNFLGRGISLDANVNVGEDSIKGKFVLNNPNYKNTDNSLKLELLATETNRLKNSGYKTNQTGFGVGTRFEYYDDLYLNLGNSFIYENLETDSTASAKLKKQEGNYIDYILKLNLDYDKRNQKFQTTEGFRTTYGLGLPVISESYTFENSLKYKYFTELFEENISSFSFLLSAANSIKNEDVKLSERLFIPSNNLRGFESGKVGPKDGKDYIGGNFMSSINMNTTLPQILPNNQNTDFILFMDIANVWGVDYDSSLDDSEIRSSIGIGVDWFTPVGPLTFSLAQPISKGKNDKTETFRFNLGTTF